MTRSSSARVYIVGAGPGDPSLLTLRAFECLQRADVILYDHRVSARVLAAGRADAERIDVGAAAPRPGDQDAITYLLAEKAREGTVVVRLKWGDPYLFDSGGKEAIFLHEQRIPFEVVPGIPLAIAGSAYAGVPLTYPGAGDTVVLVRGHEAETDAPASVDWAAVARLAGTLVCYAGARQIVSIASALLSHGRSPEEPVALVYGGTSPLQQTVATTLERVAEHAVADRPALLVAGRVAGLREYLRWFDQRPLFGRRIVVTRAREQAADLVARLEELGADPICMPAIRILPVEDFTGIDRACDGIEGFDWVAFTSANAVDHFLNRFVERRDIRDLHGIGLCAVGPATAASLARRGLRVDATPPEYRAEAIVAALCARGSVAGKRVLLPRGQIAREVLGDDLRSAGADVLEVTVYRTETPADGGQEVYRLLLEQAIDAVTFTSASTVRNFSRLLGGEQAADLLRSTAVAVIGPVTAEAARHLGLSPAIMPAEYTIPALVEALVSHFRQQPAPVHS